MDKTKKIFYELKQHIPFTLIATIIAIIIVILFQYYLKKEVSHNLFEILHPLHVIASALVTAGIFYKYRPRFIPALLVGMLGSIIIGSLSDIIFPYLGGTLLQLNTEFHLPIIENTTLILSSAIIGSVAGIFTKMTKMPHFIHVFLSVFASLFYLLAFSSTFKLLYFIGAFVVIFISVIIPCCLSDIVFPFLFLVKNKK